MSNLSTLPVTNFVSDGSLLTEWLGSFWTRVFTNPELAANMQQGNALNLAQSYLNFVQSVDVLDRRAVPVWHRERWQPIRIVQSQRNKGNANLLQIGMDPTPNIGPQVGPDFPLNKVYQIGGHAGLAGAVSYPLSDDVVDVVTCLVDNILAPNVVLVNGVDFYVRKSTIFFRQTVDPLTSGSFPVRTYEVDDAEEQEGLLWACNVLVDKDFLRKYLSYVMDLSTLSNEFYKGMLNGLWDMYNMGTPLSFFQAGVGALIGEPTIANPTETVEHILTSTDKLQVVTDKQVYDLSPDATLRDAVVVGGALNANEFLTTSIKVYDTLDPTKLAAVSEFGENMKTDISSLFFGQPFLRVPVISGLGATWEVVDITHAGVDDNGAAKLKFKLYGLQQDIDAFWNDFWNYLEAENSTSETCFQAYIDDTVVSIEGAVYGRVAPLEYFMRYFLRANACVVVVERDKLAAPPNDRDPMSLLTLLGEVIPAHIVVFIVEKRTLGPETVDLSTVQESLQLAHAKVATETVYPGGPSASQMTYLDRPPLVRWIPTCKE